MKSIFCYLGLHVYGEKLYRAGELWAEPGKVIVMRVCLFNDCRKVKGYIRDADPKEHI